jgi:transposase
MASDEPSLVPAIITQDDGPDDDDDSGSSTPGGRMEIVIGRDSRVIVDADVDAGALARVLEVLDRR